MIPKYEPQMKNILAWKTLVFHFQICYTIENLKGKEVRHHEGKSKYIFGTDAGIS
jgi:hypothetical protein